jgi:hypothetical protein
MPTPCGVTGSDARWFQVFKDAYYPEGVAEISTAGSDYDTVLWVFSGPLLSPTNLTLLACNDDVNTTNHQSRVAFRFPPPGSNAGPYWLVVGGKGVTNGALSLILGYEPTLASYGFDTNNHFVLLSSLAPPLSYQLQAATRLAPAPSAWCTVLVTNLTTNFPFLQYTEPDTSRAGGRFYRLAPADH